MQHFIKQYAVSPDVLQSREMTRLHRHSTVGIAAQSSLCILAYDHRWQLEESAEQAGNHPEQIAAFKRAVYQGFCQVKASLQDDSLALLVDPQYGTDVLRSATQAGMTVGAPIEAAGEDLLCWINDQPLYQTLLERPQAWFVKVLWRFHPDMPQANKLLQIQQLQTLSAVCDALERQLMLELIVPPEYSHDGAVVARCVPNGLRA